jgi:hypothetical protein
MPTPAEQIRREHVEDSSARCSSGSSPQRRAPATCEEGRSFDQRRDFGAPPVFVDSGARLSEVAGLRLDPRDAGANGLDLGQGVLRAKVIDAEAKNGGVASGRALLERYGAVPRIWADTNGVEAGSRVCLRGPLEGRVAVRDGIEVIGAAGASASDI